MKNYESLIAELSEQNLHPGLDVKVRAVTKQHDAQNGSRHEKASPDTHKQP